MIIYRVTTELNTPWWLNILRFFRLKKKREEFEIAMSIDLYSEGDMLSIGNGQSVKVLKDKSVNIFAGWFQTINQTNYYE